MIESSYIASLDAQTFAEILHKFTRCCSVSCFMLCYAMQEFMAWKLPVRVLESRQGTVTVPVEQLSETGQSFYQDYLTGNGKNMHAATHPNSTVKPDGVRDLWPLGLATTCSLLPFFHARTVLHRHCGTWF